MSIEAENIAEGVKTISFEVGDKVVYSSHGVGQIEKIEINTYGGSEVKFYVINLINQNMSIKVPINRATESSLRRLVTEEDLNSIYEILKTKTANVFYKSKARKFIDYKQKLNSGKITDLAEVVRDLYKADYVNTSYSQKAIYDSALNRLAGELALLQNIKIDQVLLNLESLLMSKA